MRIFKVILLWLVFVTFANILIILLAPQGGIRVILFLINGTLGAELSLDYYTNWRKE